MRCLIGSQWYGWIAYGLQMDLHMRLRHWNADVIRTIWIADGFARWQPDRLDLQMVVQPMDCRYRLQMNRIGIADGLQMDCRWIADGLQIDYGLANGSQVHRTWYCRWICRWIADGVADVFGDEIADGLHMHCKWMCRWIADGLRMHELQMVWRWYRRWIAAGLLDGLHIYVQHELQVVWEIDSSPCSTALPTKISQDDFCLFHTRMIGIDILNYYQYSCYCCLSEVHARVGNVVHMFSQWLKINEELGAPQELEALTQVCPVCGTGALT